MRVVSFEANLTKTDGLWGTLLVDEADPSPQPPSAHPWLRLLLPHLQETLGLLCTFPSCTCCPHLSNLCLTPMVCSAHRCSEVQEFQRGSKALHRLHSSSMSTSSPRRVCGLAVSSMQDACPPPPAPTYTTPGILSISPAPPSGHTFCSASCPLACTPGFDLFLL